MDDPTPDDAPPAPPDTRREMFAACALVGLLGCNGCRWTADDAARQAVDYADALIARLDRPNPKETPDRDPPRDA